MSTPLTPFVLFLFLFSTGQDLQLPRGKGHRRTLKSHASHEGAPPHPPPHSQTKDSHSTGITLLFSYSAWVLLRPTEISTFKELWDGTSGLSSLSEKTRKSNHLQMKIQRLSPQLFKVLVRSESRTHDLPRHSPVHNQVSNRCAVVYTLDTKLFMYPE